MPGKCKVPGLCDEDTLPFVGVDVVDPFGDATRSVTVDSTTASVIGVEYTVTSVRNNSSQLGVFAPSEPYPHIAYLPEAFTCPEDSLFCGQDSEPGVMVFRRVVTEANQANPTIDSGSIRVSYPNPRRIIDPTATSPQQVTVQIDSTTLTALNTGIGQPPPPPPEGCFSADTLYVVKEEAAPIPVRQLRTGQHIQCVDSGADLTTPGAVKWSEVPNFAHVDNSRSILQQCITFNRADGSTGSLTVTLSHLILRLRENGAAAVGAKASTVAACEWRRTLCCIFRLAHRVAALACMHLLLW